MINKSHTNITYVGYILWILCFINLMLVITPNHPHPLIPATGVVFTSTLILAFLCTLPRMKIPTRGENFTQLLGVLTLFFFTVATSAIADIPHLALQRSLSVFLTIIIIYTLVQSDNNIISTFNHISFLFVLFGIVSSLYALSLKLLGEINQTETGSFYSINLMGINFLQKVYGSGKLRLSSFLGNPNAFAFWLLISIMNTIYLLKRNITKHYILRIFLMIQLIALIETGSRAGILSTIGAIAFFWAYASTNHTTSMIKRIVFWFFLSVLIISLPILIQYISNFRGTSVGLSDRDIAWTFLGQSIMNNPLVGRGFGLSYEAILHPEGVEFGAHNVYLSLMSEIGFTGTMIFFFLWFTPQIKAFFYLKRNTYNEYNLIILTGLAILLGISFNQLFENSLMRFTFTTVIGFYYLFILIKAKEHE